MMTCLGQALAPALAIPPIAQNDPRRQASMSRIAVWLAVEGHAGIGHDAPGAARASKEGVDRLDNGSGSFRPPLQRGHCLNVLSVREIAKLEQHRGKLGGF